MVVNLLSFDFLLQQRKTKLNQSLGRFIEMYELNTRNGLKVVQALRDELNRDLSPLITSLSGNTLYNHLAQLCARINEMNLDNHFGLNLLLGDRQIRGKPNAAYRWLGKDRTLWKRDGRRYIVTRRKLLADTPRKEVYSIIADGLLSGDLSMLRSCPQCKRFSIARRKNQKFSCGNPKCKNDFNNQQKKEKKQFDRYRAAARERTINLIRRLADEGMSSHRIAERVKRSVRFVDRKLK